MFLELKGKLMLVIIKAGSSVDQVHWFECDSIQQTLTTSYVQITMVFL